MLYSTESTFLSFLKRAKRPQCSQINPKKPRVTPYDEETGIQQIRSQPEEEYKQLMLPVVSEFLTKLILENDQLPAPQKNSNVCPIFNAQTAPEISIFNYLSRIVKYTPCTPESYYIAIVFIDRIIQTKGLLVNSLNIHRLLITSVLIAAKIFDDTTYNNKYYSHVGGISLKELNSFEHTLLELLDFDLSVDPVLFDEYRYETELQILRYLENPEATEEQPFPPEEIEEECIDIVQARERAKLFAKKIRRSRSFNNVNESVFNKWRKRRSSSFNVLICSS